LCDQYGHSSDHERQRGVDIVLAYRLDHDVTGVCCSEVPPDNVALIPRRFRLLGDHNVCMVDIVSTDGVLGGKPRLAGRRISVLQVAEMVLDDTLAPEAVADQLDCTLAEVHAALTYYYEHPAEMDELREHRTARDEALREGALLPDHPDQ
jgi:uncharacterized protein (DUF433 family)